MRRTIIALLAWLPAMTGQDQLVFRADSRLVEVYATIRDQNGRYLDGLPRERFQLRDNGELQPLAAFESNAGKFSCAILLDTTGSMTAVLPVVKNSVIHMIDELRDEDAVAIYSFSTGLNQLADFTTDKSAAKQAVLRTRASGSTALFDSVSELAREMSPRAGKKAIVVFTDGDDNASVLNIKAAVQRAKRAGVPVYAIAEGDALKSRNLLGELKDIAEMTGGQSYQVHKTSEIAGIFEAITNDLQHTYMLAYQAPAGAERHWRTIELTVDGLKSGKIRSKEGYLPE